MTEIEELNKRINNIEAKIKEYKNLSEQPTDLNQKVEDMKELKEFRKILDDIKTPDIKEKGENLYQIAVELNRLRKENKELKKSLREKKRGSSL